MGRIKIKAIKTLAREVLKADKGKFGEDFVENKKVLSEAIHLESKKIRNVIAGYITKEVKRRKRPPITPPRPEIQPERPGTGRHQRRE